MGKSGDYSVKRTVLPLGRAINSLKKHRAIIPVQAEIQAKAQQTLTKYRSLAKNRAMDSLIRGNDGAKVLRIIDELMTRPSKTPLSR
ncbi:hypothetical protein LVJ77_12080 [Conchiformibius kuhniae]|uniref:Uncharacterized protein n=1 Tax=Conchiformibius kuhniae TaxID=211502 RepID=A0ABD8B898_9NEIS